MSNKSKWLDEFLRQDYLVAEENADSSIRDKMYAQVINALKLQELVKEEIKVYEVPQYESEFKRAVLKILQSLVEASEK